MSAYLRLVLLDHECTWDDEGYYLGEVEGSAEGLLRDRRARAYAALVALVADDAEPDESIAHALFAVEDPRALVALLLPVLVGEATSA